MTIKDDLQFAFSSLFHDENQKTSPLDNFPHNRPLLAHYTSISTLESIVRNDELWLSNPLYMNDLEELKFGLDEGLQAFLIHQGVKEACGSDERYTKLKEIFHYYYNRFNNEHAFDIYVFCLSEHNPELSDGLLSMWRGYGSNGNGAAIIFDSSKINFIQESPFIISKVEYASTEERLKWIDAKLTHFAGILKCRNVPDELLYIATYMIFERIKVYSIFTKHRGFSEEREWRVAYLRERDEQGLLSDMLHYSIGNNGIEPKLKLKISPVEGLTDSDFSLDKIVKQIILGPTVSSPLAITSVKRMLDTVGKQGISERLSASTTPFRSG